jgi:hypothetical protein
MVHVANKFGLPLADVKAMTLEEYNWLVEEINRSTRTGKGMVPAVN